MSSWRVTGGLALGFLGILACVLATGHGPVGDFDASRDAAPPLLAPTAKAGSIEIAIDDRRLRAVLSEAGWRAVDGTGAPVDVEPLLDALHTLRPLVTVDESPENPADYGLAPVAGRLEVRGPSGEPLLALDLGTRNPAWTSIYSRVSGTKAVFLVGAVLRWEIDKLTRTAD